MPLIGLSVEVQQDDARGTELIGQIQRLEARVADLHPIVALGLWIGVRGRLTRFWAGCGPDVREPAVEVARGHAGQRFEAAAESR